jgi:hypothetical protein
MSEFNIPTEVKAQILEQRLAQLNAEGYQHELLVKQFDAVGAGESDEAAASRAAIETIKAAIAVCDDELSI